VEERMRYGVIPTYKRGFVMRLWVIETEESMIETK
jgi:hypothetical protein